jgi:hypothetical protein
MTAAGLKEEAGSLVVATMPWLGPSLGVLWPLNPYKIVTTLWSVYSTKCIATITDSFYHSMKPSVPYSNNRQPEPYYAGNHSGTEQVPGPTIGFSPHLPEAGPNQNASSGWRFHTCWVSHVEEDKIHLTIALKKS